MGRPDGSTPGRRVVVLAGLGAIAGCTADRAAPQPSPSVAPPSVTPSTPSSASPTPSPSETMTPTPSESPTPTPSASAPTLKAPPWALASVPSRATITAEYAGRPAGAFGLDVRGVISRLEQPAGVALTFDACGGPGGGSGYDAALIDHLRALSVPATLFLNQRWIRANPALAGELAADPLFEVESHGTRHLPLSISGQAAYGIAGTANLGEAYDEVVGGTEWFRTTLGRAPWFFRPGTAYVDECCAAMARELGRPIAGFSVNADFGATASAGEVARNLRSARAGDIVIGHMNRPGKGTAAGAQQALRGMLDKGVRFVRLADGF